MDIDLMVPVDVIESWAITCGVRARAFDRKVDVVSAEALVLMKLNAFALDPDHPRSGQHRADAYAVLQNTNVDVAMIRQFIKDSPVLLHELDRLLAAPESRGRLGWKEPT